MASQKVLIICGDAKDIQEKVDAELNKHLGISLPGSTPGNSKLWEITGINGSVSGAYEPESGHFLGRSPTLMIIILLKQICVCDIPLH